MSSVNHTMSRANTIKLMKRYFTWSEMLQLVTFNFYSVFYNNFEIWHIPMLKVNLKQRLMLASARALKTCMSYPDPMISFERLHQLNNRATPEKMMAYKLALKLYKTYNSNQHSFEWLAFNEGQILTSRQSKFLIRRVLSRLIATNFPQRETLSWSHRSKTVC